MLCNPSSLGHKRRDGGTDRAPNRFLLIPRGTEEEARRGAAGVWGEMGRPRDEFSLVARGREG